MKKGILSIIAIAMSCMATYSQNKVYVCEGFDYDALEVASLGDITFSADGTEVNIGGDNVYKVADIDSITFHEPDFPKVRVIYNETSATVSVPASYKGVTYTVNGADVVINSTTLTDEYMYSIEGSSKNGSFTLNGNYKLTLQLAGVNLKSTKGAAVDIECGKRIAVIMPKGTVNTFEDCANGTQKAAFYTTGHPEFKGGGTINVKGNTKHAIGAKEYLQFKSSTGYVNIVGAVSDGIHCGKGKQNDDNSYFQINGGVITVNNAGSDCIDADDYGCMIIKGGVLNLNVSAVDGTGLKCDSILRMTGGEININVTGALSEGIRVCYEGQFNGGKITATAAGNGSRGIKAKKCSKSTDTVLDGGHLVFGGTDADITVSGGTYTADNTKCMGIRADQNFTQTAGTVTLNVTNSAAEGLSVKGQKSLLGGTLKE
ncbi:MAG: carbohydrate-binding domain-containing protein [Bacteroides sp.]|nr:carbohydrate-binding domain-containing protein [Roseburia sp.]MCM1347234.1 carbohydrate-binding domain-containing protein [Bacteroides sp.]MCM1421713.1 carbohydrate-binding domain-containing protein [Bacteroides sp.]